MSKYGQSIGEWNLTVGGADLHLKPTVDDHKKWLDNITKNSKNQEYLMSNAKQILKDIVMRDEPPANDLEKKELDEYLQFNIVKLVTETSIAFKIIDRDRFEQEQKLHFRQGENL